MSSGMFIPFRLVDRQCSLGALNLFLMPSAIEQSETIGIAGRPDVAVDILESLRAAMPSLSTRSRQAASFVLARPSHVIGMSAARLAFETGTSVGTVVRLCHQIGLPGIQALKLRLAAQLGYGGIADSSSDGGVGSTIFSRILEDLGRTAVAIDHTTVERVAAALRDASRILIVSSGTSQPLAIEFGNWLSSAGRTVAYPTDSRTQEAVARQLGAGDVCFAISHSGTTAATNDPLRIAAELGALTVALTSYSGSPLAQVADTAVIAGAGNDGIRGEEMASRMVHHAVLQVIRSLLSPSDTIRCPSDSPRSN